METLKKAKGKTVCAAVSGGVDSVVLLHMLKASEGVYGYTLAAVHIEHGLRGEASKGDAAFVASLCKQYAVPLYTYSFDCKKEAKAKKLSIETAAREYRYRVFESLLKEGKADFIATAHHLDDHAETVLMHLARGSSLTGARGIEERKGYLRPLLHLKKSELVRYAKANGLTYREDKTNDSDEYTRNRIRHTVLPKLELAVPNASENLVRFARLAKEDDDCLYVLSKSLIEQIEPTTAEDTGYRLCFSSSAPLFRRACLSVLKALGIERDYTSAQLESVFALQFLQSGKKISLPSGIEARREYDKICFYRLLETPREEPSHSFALGSFEMNGYTITLSDAEPVESEFGKSLRLDADAVPPAAVFRCKREGDEFEKFGGGKKSLKKYLVDRKISSSLRKELPILADEEGKAVYAVCGVEIADSIKCTAKTKRVWYISVKR